MLGEVTGEYLEFSRPPYAVDPLDEQLVKQARLAASPAASCMKARVPPTMSIPPPVRIPGPGVEVHYTNPAHEVALFDGAHGMLALLDPSSPSHLDLGDVRPFRDGPGDARTFRRLLAAFDESLGPALSPSR